MEWSERSFLLDIKPNGCFANLFVNCPEGEQRDLIRILKDGVELAANNSGTETDDILEQLLEPSATVSPECKQSLRATVGGLLLCPDTVTNYAWADDHLTFSCKLKVERWEECYFSPKSLKATLKKLTNEITLDQFCQKLKDQEIELHCHQCDISLLKENSKVTRFFQLPSSNFSETADDWFCCANHGGSYSCSDGPGQSSCTHGSPSSSINLRAPSVEQCFIGDSSFLVNGKVIENTCVAVENGTSRAPVLSCAGCQCQLGTVEVANGIVPSDGLSTVRFCHSTVDLKRKDGENQRNYLLTRFRTRERYFAWLLLSECEQQSSLKFAIKTLDNDPALLVWLLDSYSIMVNGRLSEAWNAAPFKPFPILKMLYKKLGTNDRSDPRVTGEDGSVGRLSLPRQIHDLPSGWLHPNGYVALIIYHLVCLAMPSLQVKHTLRRRSPIAGYQ